MNLLSPAEITRHYSKLGKEKADKPVGKLFVLGLLAGLFIAFGGAVSNTAVHAISNVSLTRTISSLLFPFGLCMVMLMGAELFTGNTMISISVLNGDTSTWKMLRNWGVVYLGNFAGSLLLAMACVFSGQLNYSNGGLAVYTIKTALAKCALPPLHALVLGILCNILVCTAVLCSLSAKDTVGRIAGAYIPVVFFVACGFEHCVANMFYIPAGILASKIPEYAVLAAEYGLDISALSWSSYLLQNLLPVTVGNILGGVGMGVVMWACYLRSSNQPITMNVADKRGGNGSPAKAS